MIINFTKDFQFNAEIKLKNETLETVTKTKLLGTIITNDMKWHENTKYIVKKANQRMIMLHKFAKFTNNKTHLMMGVVDSGAFISTISMSMVQRLGLEPYRVEPSCARSATDKLLIEYNVQIDLDFGGITTKCTFACITNSSYKQGLWLIGANFLEELNVDISFGKKLMYIMEKYPIKLYTTDEAANEAAGQIKNNRVANKGVDIVAPHDIMIDSTKYLDVTLKDQQRERLRGKNVIGRISSSNQALFAPQYFFETSNNWDEPVPIKIMTRNGKTTIIKRGETIFTLRQTVPNRLPILNTEAEEKLLKISKFPPSSRIHDGLAENTPEELADSNNDNPQQQTSTGPDQPKEG